MSRALAAHLRPDCRQAGADPSGGGRRSGRKYPVTIVVALAPRAGRAPDDFASPARPPRDVQAGARRPKTSKNAGFTGAPARTKLRTRTSLKFRCSSAWQSQHPGRHLQRAHEVNGRGLRARSICAAWGGLASEAASKHALRLRAWVTSRYAHIELSRPSRLHPGSESSYYRDRSDVSSPEGCLVENISVGCSSRDSRVSRSDRFSSDKERGSAG